MLRIQEGKAKNWKSRGCEKPKPESRQQPQSQKPPAGEELVVQRTQKAKAAKAAKAKQRETVNAEDAK